MKPTSLIITMLLLAATVVPVSANSSIYNDGGLTYYWVPSNILLFHIDYPWDFILYGLALVGLYYVLKKLSLVILNFIRSDKQ